MHVITVENRDTKKYRIISAGKRFYLAAGGSLEIDSGEITIARIYTRFAVVNLFLKAILFLLCILFVFLDTDYENGEFALVSVRYKCKAKLNGLKLTLVPSPLMNLNKSGELDARFIIEKKFLIAHIISVIVYSLAVIGLLIFLGIFTRGEVLLSPLFYSLAGAAACVAVYIIYYTIKRYLKTLTYLKEYYKDYIY